MSSVESFPQRLSINNFVTTIMLFQAKTVSSGWQNTSYLINPVSLFKFSSVQKLSSVGKVTVRMRISDF